MQVSAHRLAAEFRLSDPKISTSQASLHGTSQGSALLPQNLIARAGIMPNVLFIRQLIDTESATLSSLVLHVTGNPSIFAIHSTNTVQKEATNHTIHHDDDEDGVQPLQATYVELIGRLVSNRLVSRSMTAKQIPSHGSPSTASQSAQREETARLWQIICRWP